MNPLCIHCGSGTIKHGRSRNSQRYKCKSCGKAFAEYALQNTERMPELPPYAPSEILLNDAPVGSIINELRVDALISANMLGRESGYTHQAILAIEKKGGGNWHTICSLFGAMGYNVIARRREDG